MNKILIIVTVVLSFTFCNTEEVVKNDSAFKIDLPSYFDVLTVPEKNQITESKIELGSLFFFDTALSLDSTISCSSCHLPEFAFTDQRAKSIGVSGKETARNSPTLINLAYHPYYMFDGGIPTLELQPIAPIMHPDEMGFNLFEASSRFNKNAKYFSLSKKAFGEEVNPKVIAYSLAAYQRSLLAYQSKYDSYLQGDTNALNSQQLRGKELFFSDSLNCAACHGGFNFTDYKFYNIGLYLQYADKGREKVTERDSDNGKFKTPTLRNIEVTFPYMHDGSIKTIDEVIEFKMSGGEEYPLKSEKVKQFHLSDSDKKALKAFLLSLSDK